MQGIKIRGMVLYEKFFDACCRTSLPGSLPGSFVRTENLWEAVDLPCMVSLPGRFDKGAEHQAELFIWHVYV